MSSGMDEKLKNQRVVIENLAPIVDGGKFPVKRAVGEEVNVSADIFVEGHDSIKSLLLYRLEKGEDYFSVPMEHMGNDRWQGSFFVSEKCPYFFTLEAWVDPFLTWKEDLTKKVKAEKYEKVDFLDGAALVESAVRRADGRFQKKLRAFKDFLRTAKKGEKVLNEISEGEILKLMERFGEKKSLKRYENEVIVDVERERALFSSWYEFFPRSFSSKASGHGTFKSSAKMLEYISDMGFDVVYLPPIHPIGKTARKGKNNTSLARKDDVGSPWAIGSEKGGHKEINPSLGTLKDLKIFIRKAHKLDLEIAMDIAFQCSRDHPYLSEHPEWFKWRENGTIQFAENPPKRYEDIVPISFDTKNKKALWEELKSVVFYWMDQGVKIFRVDNPHTKPFDFWEWLISESRKKDPDVIFLAEAFTRPKIMKYLAKIGFSQSYTYFTWRETKKDFEDYMNELTKTDCRDYMRPNFWPNTPDILPEHLQHGGRPAFILRFVLASTLSSNYGIYGPAFELCENRAMPSSEEYRDSEKYELKEWDQDRPGNIRRIIKRVNTIRKKNTALKDTFNLQFCQTDNDQLLCYLKISSDRKNVVFVAANLDLHNKQSGWVRLPFEEIGFDPDALYSARDMISEDEYTWTGRNNYIELDPRILPVHVINISPEQK